MTNLNTVNRNEIKDDSQKQLIDHVDSIIKEIESGKFDFESNDEYEEPYASYYIDQALDIEYIVSRDKSYKGARLLVAFGGPNIWINTRTRQVEGYWGGDSYIQSYFEDKIGLDNYLEEIFLTATK